MESSFSGSTGVGVFSRSFSRMGEPRAREFMGGGDDEWSASFVGENSPAVPFQPTYFQKGAGEEVGR